MKPFFSIIIPVYNVKTYLDDCVNSVLGQEFSDWEAILVDDGSTDGSGEFCGELAQKDPRIRVIHQENRGLAGARNSGMAVAEGDWLLFLDSDDFFLPGFLTSLKAEMDAGTGYDVYVGTYSTVSHTGELIARNSCPQFAAGPAPEGSLSLRFTHYYNMVDVTAWKMAVNRQWQRSHDLWFVQEVRYAEDVVWSLQLFQLAPRILYVDLPFIAYRVGRPGSLTSTARPPLRNLECRIIAWKQFENGGKFANGTKDDAFVSSFAANKVVGEFQSQIKFSPERDEQYSAALRMMAENKNIAAQVRLGTVPLKRVVAAKLLSLFGVRMFAELIVQLR